MRLFITGTDDQTIGIALNAAQQYLYIVIIFLVFLGLLFVYRNAPAKALAGRLCP